MVRRNALLLAWFWPLLAVAGEPPAPGPDLPPAADRVRMLQADPGAAIGLPQGTTTAYALGRSLLQQGETEAALAYLLGAYRQAPDSWLIAETFAHALVDAGYLGDAVSIYGRLVAAAPDSLTHRRQYALLLAQTGQARRALDQVGALRRRGVADPDLVKLQADLLGQLDQVDAALAVYREAGRRDPVRVEDYYLAAGALLERKQRHDELAGLLHEGLAAAPASRSLAFGLLRHLVHRGDLAAARHEAAAADERRRIAGVADGPECSLELADLLLRQGRIEDAREVLAPLMEAGRRSLALETRLSRIFLAQERFDEAASVLAAAIERWPADGELRYLQGRALEMQADLPGALVQVAAAIELDPDQAAYRIALLRLHVLQGRAAPDAAADTLRVAVHEHALRAAETIDPRDSHGHLILGYAFRFLAERDLACRHFQLAGEAAETRVIAHLELSLCLQDGGHTEEALRVLRALQAEFPDDPEVANNLAYTLAERGEDLQRAEALVRQALRSDPQNGAYLDSLGWVLYQQGDYAGAFDWLVEAANQRPDDPTILEHLGLTLHRLGKPLEAADVLRRAIACGGDAPRLQAVIAEIEHGR
jgi:tetratricopeptide (TPR) repeat protein